MVEWPPVHRSVILGAARTPFGRLLGGLAPVSAVDLGAVAARGAIERSQVPAAEIGYCVFGTVIQAGQGHIPSRQVSLAVGMRDDAGSETINKVCASGLRAIAIADVLIKVGDYDTILAGGTESMTNAPHLALGARKGYRFGDASLIDSMIWDALRDPWSGLQMFEQASNVGAELGIDRADLDAWSARSHERAVAAIDSGRFGEEIVPVTIPGRKGDTLIDTDEGPRRDTSVEALAALKPLTPGGTHTAGNSPGVNDGAAAVVVASEEEAQRRGLQPLAIIRATACTADRHDRLARVPALAAQMALEKAALAVSDIDRLEINEAFASVAFNSTKMLDVPEDRVNVNGGAVALGHPVGASGARLIVTLIYELRRIGGGIGVAAICSGGGQGDAMVLEVPAAA
jgi:acetyl-CoA C-acetyltransferase